MRECLYAWNLFFTWTKLRMKHPKISEKTHSVSIYLYLIRLVRIISFISPGARPSYENKCYVGWIYPHAVNLVPLTDLHWTELWSKHIQNLLGKLSFCCSSFVVAICLYLVRYLCDILEEFKCNVGCNDPHAVSFVPS